MWSAITDVGAVYTQNLCGLRKPSLPEDSLLWMSLIWDSKRMGYLRRVLEDGKAVQLRRKAIPEA